MSGWQSRDQREAVCVSHRASPGADCPNLTTCNRRESGGVERSAAIVVLVRVVRDQVRQFRHFVIAACADRAVTPQEELAAWVCPMRLRMADTIACCLIVFSVGVANQFLRIEHLSIIRPTACGPSTEAAAFARSLKPPASNAMSSRASSSNAKPDPAISSTHDTEAYDLRARCKDSFGDGAGNASVPHKLDGQRLPAYCRFPFPR